MKLPKNFSTIGLKFYPFQLETFLFSIRQNNTGLLLEMGTGKSMISINVARYRIQFDKIRKVLVVCPSSVIYNWKTNIEKLSEYKPTILHDTRINRLKNLNEDYRFGIINYESLFPLLKDLRVISEEPPFIIHHNYKEMLNDLQFDMIIFDESAKFIRNHSARRTIASTLFADTAKYKMILTGTPIANRPNNLWSQFRVLDGGESFGRSYEVFKNVFFYKDPNDHFGRLYLRLDKIEDMKKRIYTRCIRKTKKEVLPDLPEQIHNTLEIEMSSSLENLYKEVKRSILSEIETEEGITTLRINNILLRLMRLQQITSGFTAGENHTTVELTEQPKLNALIEHIEIILEEESSVIVWCRFRKSISMIAKQLNRLKIPFTAMTGDDNEKIKYEKWKGFQESSTVNVFIGQIEAGGIGIELFKLDSKPYEKQYTFFYENVFTLDTREQAISRPHRIGQKSICIYTDFVLKNTIDEKILRSVENKKNIADVILGDGVHKFLE